MVRILVQNASGRRFSYDVQLSDTVYNLKSDIEDTEGIPIDEQTLEFGKNGLDGFLLRLDDNTTFKTYNIQEDSTIFLNLHRFIVFVKTLSGKTITLLVSPEYTCWMLKEMIREKEGISTDSQRFILGPNQSLVAKRGQKLEDHLTLVSYGITSEATLHLDLTLRGGGGIPTKAHAIVLRSWDGNMRDDDFEGLPLKRGQVVFIKDLVHKNWYRGELDQSHSEGALIPRNFVSIFRILDDEFRAELGAEPLPLLIEGPPSSGDYQPKSPIAAPGATSALGFLTKPLRRLYKPSKINRSKTESEDHNTLSVIPKLPDEIPNLTLPEFPYPKISPQFFTVNLGDKGLSFVEVAVTINPITGERPLVDVLLKCCPAHPRRISSVVLTLTFDKGNLVRDIQPKEQLGPLTQTEIEKTDNTSKSVSGGLEREGVTINAEWKHEVEEAQSATRRTQMKIAGTIKNNDTAHWSLTEDTGQGGQGGLPKEVPMSFTLSVKPTKVVYKCRVTHVKGRAEKERYSDETRIFC